MKERIAKWLESLDEEEKCQAELLDAYFTFRTNMPGDDPGFGKAVEEPKTTQEIIDDLVPMMFMDKRRDFVLSGGKGNPVCPQASCE